ncbi:MAG: SRPBCC domain-containing protein [Terracidiphilus sp.]
MIGQDYSASITANLTAEATAERISHVADWWTASFSGASEKVGDTFSVRWGETFVDFAVVEFVPAKKIVWRVTDCNLPFVEDRKEWKNTEVIFDISTVGAETTVTMTHSGLQPGVECYETCKAGWNFFITESLQQLLTLNQGMPDRVGKRESAQEAGAVAQ